jgi:hypothetical protein
LDEDLKLDATPFRNAGSPETLPDDIGLRSKIPITWAKGKGWTKSVKAHLTPKNSLNIVTENGQKVKSVLP